jgi:hypothetical protein
MPYRPCQDRARAGLGAPPPKLQRPPSGPASRQADSRFKNARHTHAITDHRADDRWHLVLGEGAADRHRSLKFGADILRPIK